MAKWCSLEGVEVILFGDRYRGRRVLLTGHTGFKGSWLALWLRDLGADVTGLALPAETDPNHWQSLGLEITAHLQDIRDSAAVARIVAAAKPEVIFHLAAQPLVRRSYRDPLQTWSTNVMGTANLLEACREVPGVRAVVVVTSDKCYENREWPWGYRERDRLGGHDPYSASKAATELLIASYRKAFFDGAGTPLLASARAGNVIGGGDWSEDRLIPDLVRAIATGRPLEVRSPDATRPWQHVLESLSGYLLLGQVLMDGRREFATAWNFGPDVEGNCSVAGVLTKMQHSWPELAWRAAPAAQLHEANLLYLDSAQARTHLGWQPVWALPDALRATAEWYRGFLSSGRVASADQLRSYLACARGAGRSWAGG